MQTIGPSDSAIEVLRSISRASFSYTQTKTLCEAAGWPLVDDEPDLGFVNCEMLLKPDCDGRRLLTVLVAEKKDTPLAFVPLFYYDDYDKSREPFDSAFQIIAERITALLGTATRSGEYSYPHRAGWSYSFIGWQMPDATLVLVQDEFDLQFGMDITLWVQPAGTPIQAPVRCE